MVRTIDGAARRELLADAVWTLIRDGGLEAASVRAVAVEAGVSAGSVRHFFATQDELHIFAMKELSRRVTARVERTLRDTDPGAVETPGHVDRARNRVKAGLIELLPTTTENSADFAAHLQFVVKAVVYPSLADAARESHRELHDFYARCIDYLSQVGAIAPSRDLDRVVCELGVVMEGMVLRRLTAPDLLSVDAIHTMLEAHLVGLGSEVPA